jgi:hypothetical protein
MNPPIKKIWRKGKWTEEEEAYAEKIILGFNAGIIDVPPGTTLRSAMSELLNWLSDSLCIASHRLVVIR